MIDTDRDWRIWGETDPFYGVVSAPQFRREQVDLDAFFQTGDAYIQERLGRLERQLGMLPRRRALDFGCGVGRVALPLAGLFDEVVGLDVGLGFDLRRWLGLRADDEDHEAPVDGAANQNRGSLNRMVILPNASYCASLCIKSVWRNRHKMEIESESEKSDVNVIYQCLYLESTYFCVRQALENLGGAGGGDEWTGRLPGQESPPPRRRLGLAARGEVVTA